MGFYAALEDLYKNIKKARPDMTEAQVRAEAERYVQNAMQPMLSEGEIYELLENKDFLRDGVPPRKLPRYSGAERKARREKAKAVRQGVYDFIALDGQGVEQYKYRLNEGGQRPDAPGLTEEQRQEILRTARRYENREEQRMFRYIPPTATPQERARLEAINREAAFLFDTNEVNWEKYYTDTVAQRKSSGDARYAGKTDEQLRAELETEIKTRRGSMIMDRLREVGRLADKLDDLSNPALSGEELAANYVELRQAAALCWETDNYLSNFGRNRSIVSEEDKEYTKALREMQGRFVTAAGRIVIYGNPTFELFDPSALDGIDSRAVGQELEDRTENMARGQKFQRDRERKHTNWNTYARGGKVREHLDTAIEDADSSYTCEQIRYVFNDVLEANGFTPGEGGARVTAEHFNKDGSKTVKENAGADELAEGRPLVVEQDGRVAVLCQRYPTSTELVWDKPEKLFNYSLRYENDKLLEQVAESDKWYKSRSTAFKEMRQSFEAIAKLTKDGLTENPQQRKALTEKYSELLLKTEAYLEKKRKEGVGDGHNDVEQGHIRVAKALKQYALDKLGDLEIVDKASNALERYAGMSPEEKRKAAKRDLYNAQQKEVREDMTQWLKDQCAAFPADLPQGFLMETKNRAVMLGALLEANYNEEWVKPVYMCSEKTEDFATYTVGSLIAAEMVKNERAQRLAEGKAGPGAFETRMQNDYRAIVRELGEAAAKYTVGEPKGEMIELFGETKQLMSHEQFTEFLTIFNTEEMAREMPEARAVQQRVEAEQREAQERAEQEALAAREAADKPLREEQEKLNKVGLGIYTFAQKDIVPLMDKLRGSLADGKTTYGLRDSVDLLSSYVILGMIQMEELGGSSKLERAMRDDEAAKTLQVNLQMTDGFRGMLKEIATEDGNAASIEKISKVLTEKKPQELARKILTDTKFKQSLESNMKAQGIEHSKGFRLGDKPPVNGKNEPPVMGQH